MSKDKNIGKVLLVYLPNNSRPTHRWIVSKRDDGRYIARAPKNGVLLRNLSKKLEKDYNSHHLLPKDISFFNRYTKRSKIKKYKTKKKKTKKKY